MLLSMHHMEEAYTLCDEVAILDRAPSSSAVPFARFLPAISTI